MSPFIKCPIHVQQNISFGIPIYAVKNTQKLGNVKQKT